MTHYQRSAVPPSTCNAVFRCLADGRNRLVLRTLRSTEGSSVTRKTLVSVLVEEFYRSRSIADPADRARTALHHELLPRLSSVDLVEFDERAVSATEHPVFETASVLGLLAPESNGNGADPDTIFDLLANDRRRLVWAVLRRRDAISVETLARVVAQFEHDDRSAADFESLAERVHVSLVHDHVPRLEAAGLVRRTPDDRLEMDADSSIDPSSVMGVDPVDASLFG